MDNCVADAVLLDVSHAADNAVSPGRSSTGPGLHVGDYFSIRCSATRLSGRAKNS